MRKTLLMIGCIIVVVSMSSSGAALFSTTAHLQGTLDGGTTAIFVGQTSITGTFTGYPMKTLINSPAVQGINAFPLLEATSILDLDTVIVAENINITAAHSLEELFLLNHDNILQYSDVDVTTDNGVFLLGVTQGTLKLQTDLQYAVTSLLPLALTQGATTPFFLTATTIPLTLQFSGDRAVLAQLSDTGLIQVTDKQGAIRWSGNSKNTYLLIQDSSFSITQQPPLFLFPLSSEKSDQYLQLSVAPADSKQVNTPKLLEDISGTTAQFGDMNLSGAMKAIHGLGSIMSTASAVANGALLLIQSNDTVTVDHSSQTFSGFGFARFNSLDVTYSEGSTGPTLKGDCTLIFLGDHFYNPQAKNSADGLAFPFELVIIWVVALCVFVYIHYFLRPDVNEDKNDGIKRYALIFHVIMLIIAFVLLDREVSGLFGTSAGDALVTQGFSFIAGALLLFELFIWGLGFLVLAIPARLLTISGLRLLGIGKGGKGIGKGVGDFFIWIFCGLYVHLMMNAFLAPFHLNNLFSVG